MLRFSVYALATAALWTNVGASPIVERQEIETEDLLGFDASLVTGVNSRAAPEVRVLRREDFANDTNLEAPPFVPPELIEAPPFVPGSPSKRFIVGTDNRARNAERGYPYSAIGRVHWTNGVYCTAALVGPRHILTARQCLQPGLGATFTPGFNGTAPHGTSGVRVTVQIDGPSGACALEYNWAILVLHEDFGNRLGFLGATLPNAEMFDQPIFTHQGYPEDRDGGRLPQRQLRNSIASRNSLDCDEYGPIYTDTDTAPGQAGGPLWETRDNGAYVWGALSASYRSSEFTYAGWASGQMLVEWVIRMRTDYP